MKLIAGDAYITELEATTSRIVFDDQPPDRIRVRLSYLIDRTAADISFLVPLDQAKHLHVSQKVRLLVEVEP